MTSHIARHLTVFFSGAAVLALEILAGRFMVPAFGSSIFIWGAVLSVTLICLAIGYRWGGVVAERCKDDGPLTRNLFLSAAWIALIPVFGHWMLRASLATGQLLGPIVLVLLLFAFPLTLLATVVPLCFGSAVRGGDDTPAKTVGDLFAVSTVGSVVGALITAYAGVPILGLSRSFFVAAALLLVVAIPRAIAGSRTKTAIASLAIIVAGKAFGPLAVEPPTFVDGVELIHSTDTRYGHLDVLEDHRDGSRIMVIDGASQSWAQGPDWLQSRYRYVEMLMRQVKRYELERERALVLGVGAGTLIRQLRAAGYEVDAVEIDRAVIDAGLRFFGLEESDADFHLADGRAFIESLDAKPYYDLVVFDVAGGGYQPEHIYNGDAYRSTKRRLKPGGALVLNLVTITTPVDRVTRYQTATMKRAFSSVEVIDLMPTPGSNSRLSSVLIVGADQTPPTPFESGEFERLIELSETIRPVTDDWNPIALWSAAANAEWHDDIRVWLGDAAVFPW